MSELKWWQKSIVYQIYPKSFQDTTGTGVGDLPGVTSHLDYLKSLGTGAIWLTPVYPSPMVDNGYDISDYCGIDPSYGTMEDMEELIAEAKKRDIRIVMDLVYNHTSDQHPWFLESKKDRTNPKADWYIWRDAKPDGSAPTNWRAIFGGSAWKWCEERQQYYLHTFAEAQPDLNWENPEVRQALFDAANFWLDKGVGGFRIDAIVYIKKPEFKDGPVDGADGLSGIHEMTANTPGILDFLHEFRRKVFDGHDIFTVGEANGVSPQELPQWVGKDGVFSMLFEFSHLELSYPKGEIWCKRFPWKLGQLKDALSASQAATAKEGWYPIFFENHDQNRSMHRYFPEGTDPKAAAKALATVLFTLRGTPFVYEGEEIGMTNTAFPKIEDYNDISTHGQYEYAIKEGLSPEEALKAVQFQSRDNARTPMQWTAGKNAGFTDATPWLAVNPNYKTINAEAALKDPDSTFYYYQKLIRLRHAYPIIVYGTFEPLLEDDPNVYAFARHLGGETLLIACNWTSEEVPCNLFDGKDGEELISNYASHKTGTLQPYEARVLLLRNA